MFFKVLYMDAQNYLQDLKEIKDLMNKSTQFISLSGLSGILAGIYALLGAGYVYYLIENHGTDSITLESTAFKLIALTAILVLAASWLTAYFQTVSKAKKMGEKVWNASSKRLLINFLIPLVTGGIFILLSLRNGYFSLAVPMMLIFYGLACVNASKYTLRDVRYLGISEIIIGLLAVEFSGFGLYFWALGFGVCHIVYGAIMHFKYDMK